MMRGKMNYIASSPCLCHDLSVGIAHTDVVHINKGHPTCNNIEYIIQSAMVKGSVQSEEMTNLFHCVPALPPPMNPLLLIL